MFGEIVTWFKTGEKAGSKGLLINEMNDFVCWRGKGHGKCYIN